MKNFIKSLVAFIVVMAIGIMSVGCHNDKNDSSSNSGSESSDSGHGGEISVPTQIVELLSISDKISGNPESGDIEEKNGNLVKVTLGDLLLLKDHNYISFQNLLDGILFGSFVKEQAESLDGSPSFNLYDNGYWYLDGNKDKLVRFPDDLNAIFNYDLGGKTPLEIADIEKNGDKNLVGLIKDELGIDLRSAMTEGVTGKALEIMNSLLEMTERDFYNETKSSHEFSDKFLKSYKVTEVADAVMDMFKTDETADMLGDISALIADIFNDSNLYDFTIGKSANIDNILAVAEHFVVAQESENVKKINKNIRTLTDEQTKLNTEKNKLDTAAENYESELAIKTERLEQIDRLITKIQAKADAIPDKIAAIKNCFKHASDLFDGEFDGTIASIKINENAEVDLNAFVAEVLTIMTGKTDTAAAAQMIVDFANKTIALQESLANVSENEKVETIVAYLNDLTSYNDESGETIGNLNQDFATQLVMFIMESSTDIAEPTNKFMETYGKDTVSEIDGYLNGYIGRFLTSLDIAKVLDDKFSFDLNKFMNELTLDSVMTFVDNPFNLIEYIFKHCIQPQFDEMITKNPDATLKDYDIEYLHDMLAEMAIGDETFTGMLDLPLGYMTDLMFAKPDDPTDGIIDQFKLIFASAKEIIKNDGTLAELDELFGGSYAELAKNYGCEEFMKLKVSDIKALIDGNATEEVMNAAKNINLKFIIEAIAKLQADMNSMLGK